MTIQQQSTSLQEIQEKTGIMSDSVACLRKSKSAKNLLSSQEFEKVDSLNTSLDAGKIQSVCIPEDKSHSEKQIKRRRGETYWEMIINLATNLRFNLEMWTEAFWPCDDSKKKKAYLLGKEYEPEKLNDLKRMRTAFSHILWFSYRKNFPMLNDKSHPESESFISDTGWGCMIRVCQMMFAECLKRHCLSNKTCCNEELPCLQNEKLNYEVASWFLDSESDSTVAPYSIQTLSARLQDTFKLKPGIWLKPSSVLFALQGIHQDFGHAVAPGLQMEIYIESTLYVTQALKKVTCLDTSSDNSFDKAFEKDFEVIEMKKSEKEEHDEEDKQESCENIDDLGSDVEDIVENHSIGQLYLENAREIEKLMSHKWRDSLIVFMLAKIGLDKPNPEYIPFIKDLLSYPESVGMIGGKPGLAYYIVGYIEDKLVYLDPHFVQESVQSKKLLKENMHTYYASSIKHVGFTDIDTSVTLGFFIKDEKSFKGFIDRFRISCASNESFLCIELDEPRENTTDVESVCETYEDYQKGKDEDEFERI